MIPYDALIPASRDLLAMLDWLLHAAHVGLIAFILGGWLVPAWRGLHLMMIGAVWLCWLGLGFYVGHIGYCILTDWHWQVKTLLGQAHLPSSYIEYLYWQAGGGDIDDTLVAALTAVALILTTCLSAWLWLTKPAGKEEEV